MPHHLLRIWNFSDIYTILTPRAHPLLKKKRHMHCSYFRYENPESQRGWACLCSDCGGVRGVWRRALGVSYSIASTVLVAPHSSVQSSLHRAVMLKLLTQHGKMAWGSCTGSITSLNTDAWINQKENFCHTLGDTVFLKWLAAVHTSRLRLFPGKSALKLSHQILYFLV